MAFKIGYYEKNGKADVRDFIELCDVKTRAKIKAKLTLLSIYGWQLKYPETEKVGDDIFALRIEYENNEYRFFYFFHAGAVIPVVHYVHKKSRKLKPRDIEKAEKRRREILDKYASICFE